jgi:GTP-binding protein HflX
MLFATLDPKMRAVKLNNKLKIIISDTVGFISDLPTELIAAFRATLEEVVVADLILHVRDIAHKNTDLQSMEVEKVLQSLGISESTPILEIWNKIDSFEPEQKESLKNVVNRRSGVCYLSALTGEGVSRLLEQVEEIITPQKFSDTLILPFEFGNKKAWLHENGVVVNELYTDTGFELDVMWSAQQKAKYYSFTR